MRIGIDVRCLSEGKRTGVEEYTLALLQGLFRLAPEHEYVLFFNSWKRTVPDFAWADGFPNVKLRIFHFPNKLLNFCLWYLKWPKLDRLIGGTDVFFVPNLNFVAVSSRSKLVVTAHDLSFETFPETFSWKQRLWHFFVNFRGLVRRADAVIAVSQSTARDLSAYYGVPERKISVILSGVGSQFARMSRNDPSLLSVQTKYKLPYKFILALATFEPRKNLLSLIEAYEALQKSDHARFGKYGLVLAGTAGWKCEEVFEAIERSPYRGHILLPGFIDDGDKPSLYNLATVFVYPSFYEGFGFPPLEAMACGAPVIVSHASSLPEIVGSTGLMIDPFQPDELLRALIETLTAPELSSGFSQKGLERAGQFRWERTAALTQEVFLRVSGVLPLPGL